MLSERISEMTEVLLMAEELERRANVFVRSPSDWAARKFAEQCKSVRIVAALLLEEAEAEADRDPRRP